MKTHWNIENNSNQYMKNIVNKINESKNNLLSEIQNESSANAEYHTYNFENAKKKFKKGFLTFNESGEFITLTCYNTYKDLAELIGADEDTYKQYDNIKIGGCGPVGDNDGTETQVLRIW